MKGGALAMSQKERSRLVVMSRVKEKTMTMREASEMMGVSYRQVRRIYQRYVQEGDKGLIHRNRGRPSNRRKAPEVKEIALALYREQCWNFGPTLAAENLVEWMGMMLTVRLRLDWENIYVTSVSRPWKSGCLGIAFDIV